MVEQIQLSTKQASEGAYTQGHETPDLKIVPKDLLTRTTGAVRLVKTWEVQEPPPREFFIEGLIPEGFCTQFYGDGGVGKSYLATHLATTVVLGRDYGDRKVKQSNVVYVDGELDADEFVRRAYMVARGLGLERPPAGLYYYPLEGPLTEKRVQSNLEYALNQSGAEFFILDSLTISTYTADPTAAPDVIAIMKYLETLGTWLCLDHVPKSSSMINQSGLRAFGSVFKGNTARSSIQLIRADGGGLALVHKKTNFSALQSPLHVKLSFNEKDVRVQFVEVNDPSMEGIDQHLGRAEQIYIAVTSVGESGGTATDIHKKLTEMGIEMTLKTVQNHISTLHRTGRIEHHPLAKNRWIALSRFRNEESEVFTNGEVDDIPF